MTDAPEAPAWLHRVHELGSSDRLRGAWPSPEPGARDGQPELGQDPRFHTHGARAAHIDEVYAFVVDNRGRHVKSRSGLEDARRGDQ